jgi:hypothetical protein
MPGDAPSPAVRADMAGPSFGGPSADPFPAGPVVLRLIEFEILEPLNHEAPIENA